MKNRSFPASVFITGIVFLMVFVNLKDDVLFVLVFAIIQLFTGIAAVLLILLRFFRIIKSRSSFFYSLTGTVQLALLITDILLLFDQNLAKRTISVFTGLNALLGICILTDIHLRNKRKLKELRV